MNQEFFVRNREKLAEKLEDESLTIMFAGEAPPRSADEEYHFVPNRNFYYITGIERPKMVFAAKKIGGKTEEMLFIEEGDPVMAKWVGANMTKEEAKEASGIDKIFYLDKLTNHVHMALQGEGIEKVNLNLELQNWDAPLTEAHHFAKTLQEKYPHVSIGNVYGTICQLRLVKSPEEVEKIRKAIKITREGIENIMQHAEPGKMEYELEAHFNYTLQSNGIKEHAFPTIAATGKNATILHYGENNAKTEDGDLVLFDLGAAYQYYSADLTRTFPVNGKFSDRQKQLYNIVLKALKETTEMIKPGVEFSELNKHTKKVLAEGCMKIGLIEKEEDIQKYYYHGVSHSMGLDTHDVGRYRNLSLEPGMVFTVEPGLYVEEENIGIRIEDDVLVTEDGHENLSEKMIRTVEDIEAYMASR
ncbi:MAG TPA: aminopeptidase P family protein [Bacillales bacterium]|nr:aminopeptidase P family protein [Bacillales bacterium]